MNPDFDPEKAFRELDQDRDGCVTALEIYRFMKEVLYIRISISEAEMLIREFDGNLDGRLSIEEFYQFVLPATSRNLRDIALNRANISSYSYKYRPLSAQILSQLGDLIDREIRFLRQRGDIKRQLLSHENFLKSSYFRLVARDKDFITIDDMIDFLVINGSRPTTEDLEAILRRCDHTGDQLLSYHEFSEMTAFTESSSDPQKEYQTLEKKSEVVLEESPPVKKEGEVEEGSLDEKESPEFKEICVKTVNGCFTLENKDVAKRLEGLYQVA